MKKLKIKLFTKFNNIIIIIIVTNTVQDGTVCRFSSFLSQKTPSPETVNFFMFNSVKL